MICPNCHHRLDRLDFTPLGEFLARRQLSIRRAAPLIGIRRTQIHGWKARGWLSLDHAELVTDALDVHPCSIWPEYLDVAAA